jgi:hypothetical protein
MYVVFCVCVCVCLVVIVMKTESTDAVENLLTRIRRRAGSSEANKSRVGTGHQPRRIDATEDLVHLFSHKVLQYFLTAQIPIFKRSILSELEKIVRKIKGAPTKVRISTIIIYFSNDDVL